MQAYKIIEGSARALESFEQAVADALEVGYVLGGDLIAHSQASELKFYQAMVLPEDDFDDEEEDEEEDEEWEEEDV